jgi:hypothetical protein
MLLPVLQKVWDHLPENVQMFMTFVFVLIAMLALRGVTGWSA